MRKADQRWQLGVVGAVVCLAMAVSGCELPPFAPEATEREPIPEEDEFVLGGEAEAGEGYYVAQCAGCHGIDGQGDGAQGAGMRPRPTDFTETPMTARGAYEVIRDGGRAVGMSPGMPAYRDATDDQTLRDVTAYVLEFFDGDRAVDDPDLEANIQSK